MVVIEGTLGCSYQLLGKAVHGRDGRTDGRSDRLEPFVRQWSATTILGEDSDKMEKSEWHLPYFLY